MKSIPAEVKKSRDEKKFLKALIDQAEEVKWEEPDENEIPILCVEFFGGEATGKTYNALTFPKPALLDTEGKGKVVAGQLGIKKVFRAKSFYDVIDFVNACITDPEIETAVFDSSRDLVDMAESLTLAQLDKSGLYSSAGAVLYTHVNQKMDWIVQTLREHGINCVFTSRMKDEYKQNTRTGKQIRDGYKKAPYQFDIVIELTNMIEWDGEYHLTIEPIARVYKNGFVRKGTTKPYLEIADYETLIKEIFEPVNRDKYMEKFLKKFSKSE